MAEALFNKAAAAKGLAVVARSCGTGAFAGIGASPETIEIMRREEGLDVSAHRGRRISKDMADGSDAIFAMHQGHADQIEALYPGTAGKLYLLIEFYPGSDKNDFLSGIPDPIGMGMEFYRNVLRVIRESLDGVIKEIAGG